MRVLDGVFPVACEEGLADREGCAWG